MKFNSNNIDRVIVLSLFTGVSLKALIFGSSFADAAILFVLAASYYLLDKKLSSKENLELKQKLEALEASIKSHAEIISEIRTSVTGMKMKVMR